MRLATFQSATGSRPAVVEGDSLRELPYDDMIAFLESGDQAQPTGDPIALDSVTLLAPLPRPSSIRDAMSFETHVINSTRAIGLGPYAKVDRLAERFLGKRFSMAHRASGTFYKQPPYYKSNPRSVVGPDAEVRIPAYSERFDYELEWGIVIGKQGVDIPAAQAREHIAGYTIFNDFSARDAQKKEMGGRLGPAKGKDFDTGNAIGPWLVTPEELQDPYNLTMLARVNGAEWSRGSTSTMHWRWEDLIAHISAAETLYPGDFIGSGTVGNGCGLEHGSYLKSGDVVELEVEGIGVLRNRVL
jgi:2-keto-4-pentenoate hydratase/2-oxohepta-3-ene-1,7-dioic acid hydratase in catechol pathway